MSARLKINDPLDVNGRLYRQISALLEQLERRDEEKVDVDLMIARIEKALALRTDSLMRERVQEAIDDTGSTGITLRERIAALIAIGRIQIMCAGLYSGKDESDAIAGSTVRKYSKAFGAKTNVAARRGVGRAGASELANVFTLGGDDPDFDINAR